MCLQQQILYLNNTKMAISQVYHHHFVIYSFKGKIKLHDFFNDLDQLIWYIIMYVFRFHNYNF